MLKDEQLRELVRDAIARHLERNIGEPASTESLPRHASHGRFLLTSGSDGACLIEPSVGCTHCGYCLSYGH
jgi:hypothetical protein